MKVYISGPITGTDDYLQRFREAEEKLKKAGFTPYNPAAVNSMMPAGTTYEEYMKISFVLLDLCEAIYLLPGWEKSLGANREYGYALGKDKVILDQEKKSVRGGRDSMKKISSFTEVDFSELKVPMIVICYDASDYPGIYAARVWEATVPKPTDCVLTSVNLDPLLDDIRAAGFGIKIPRAESDDPVIVECWV